MTTRPKPVLDEIRERLNKSSKGPWFTKHFGIGGAERTEHGFSKTICQLNPNTPDAEFIAHIRTDAELLLAFVEATLDWRKNPDNIDLLANLIVAEDKLLAPAKESEEPHD